MTLAHHVEDMHAPEPPTALSQLMDGLGVRMNFAKDEEIYAQEDDADLIYRVVSGVVRTTRLLADGRRQVGGFYQRGELFGVEVAAQHRYSAEGLCDCTIQVVKRSALHDGTGRAEFDRAVWEATCRELERAQEHVLLLGRKTACEKVATFLLELAAQQAGEVVDLPMGRQDMADYLGLTIETVSRMLTQLQGARVVEFAACRQFRVIDTDVLRRLAA